MSVIPIVRLNCKLVAWTTTEFRNLKKDYSYFYIKPWFFFSQSLILFVSRITVRPDPPFNCTSGDRTLFSVHVWCTQGFDGGVAQRFALEAYDSAGRAGAADGGPSGPDDGYGGPAVAADGPAPPMLANLTADRPDFTLRQLSPSVGLRLAVYAYNSRGTSDRTWLTAYTLNSADKQTTSGTYITILT